MEAFYHPYYNDTWQLPYHIKCIGGFYDQTPIDREDGYPYYQILTCTGGQGELTVLGDTYSIKKNMVYILPADLPHQYVSIKPPWTINFIAIDGYGLDMLLEGSGLDKMLVTQIKKMDQVMNQMTDLYRISKTGKKEDLYRASIKVYALLLFIKEVINQSAETIDDSIIKVEQVQNLMEEQFYKDISLDFLADSIGCSKQYVCQLFSKHVGERPIYYLNELRVQKAIELLLNHKSLKTAEIAIRVGFRDASYFGVVFKKSQGISPGQYRKKYGY